MGVLLNHDSTVSGWIRKEIELKKPLKKNSRGQAVSRVQEWLVLNGHRVVIDGDFGSATDAAVRNFQRAKRLAPDGVVGKITHAALVAPALDALTPIPAGRKDFAQLTLAYTRKHLKHHPLEIGGQNRGPWVRLYMEGNEGSEWAWCAGFVTFMMKQAAQTLGIATPVKGSVSCDTLASQAKTAGLFVRESDIRSGRVPVSAISAASLFLVRRTSTDWVHTGVVTGFENEFFQTIEGNTNDEGHREGYEVCARMRGYKKKDFIRLDV